MEELGGVDSLIKLLDHTDKDGSLFSSENIQLQALTALENIMRTVAIKEDVIDLLVALASDTTNEETSKKAFDMLRD